MKKRGLGKGLSELGVSELLAATTAVLPEKTINHDLTELSIETLSPGKYQPRRKMSQEALEELANSIRAQGVIQPIIVRKIASGYEIIAGERRWRAAKLAGLNKVPVVIKHLSDEQALAISLIENIQRQDLNVIEEAYALQRLIDEFNMTHQSVADAVGKSRASVTNILRLLKLNPDVRDMVLQGVLDMGHARALLALEGEQQSSVANIALARSLTVRDTERMIRKLLNPIESEKIKRVPTPDIDRLQENLAVKLKAQVAIKQNPKGRGKLVIFYDNIDQLDDILAHIQ